MMKKKIVELVDEDEILAQQEKEYLKNMSPKNLELLNKILNDSQQWTNEDEAELQEAFKVYESEIEKNLPIRNIAGV